MPGPRLNVPVPLRGGVPPVAVTVTVEVPPLHCIGVAEAFAISAGGSVTVIDVVAVHPFASVTVKVWPPAPRLKVPVPLRGGVPPVAVTVTVEVPPLQRIGVALEETVSGGGSVMFT